MKICDVIGPFKGFMSDGRLTKRVVLQDLYHEKERNHGLNTKFVVKITAKNISTLDDDQADDLYALKRYMTPHEIKYYLMYLTRCRSNLGHPSKSLGPCL